MICQYGMVLGGEDRQVILQIERYRNDTVFTFLPKHLACFTIGLFNGLLRMVGKAARESHSSPDGHSKPGRRR